MIARDYKKKKYGVVRFVGPTSIICMGYHRLWAHRAYTAREPLRIPLALSRAVGFHDSIRVNLDLVSSQDIHAFEYHFSVMGLAPPSSSPVRAKFLRK